MGVSPARTERRNASDSRELALAVGVEREHGPWPCGQLALHHEWRSAKVNVGIGDLGVQGGDEGTMLHLQQNFGQPSNAGGTFTVSNVRFDRANGAKLFLLRVALEGLGQASDFDGIAQSRAR